MPKTRYEFTPMYATLASLPGVLNEATARNLELVTTTALPDEKMIVLIFKSEVPKAAPRR